MMNSMAKPPNKALQTDTTDRHAFCIRKMRASPPCR